MSKISTVSVGIFCLNKACQRKEANLICWEKGGLGI